MEISRVNDRDRTIEVSESKDHVKDAPNFSDDDDVTPDFEERIRRHFGLQSSESSTDRGSYGRYSGATGGGEAGRVRTGDNPLRDDRTETEGHSERSMGGAQDPEVYDERERGSVGQESYRDREDVGSEPAGGTGEPPSGGVRDLEPGEPGRATGSARDEDAGSMTRGHREEGGREGFDERGELEMSEQGRMGDEGYREGYREGLREGLRAGLRDSGDIGTSGTATGSGATEEGMSRRGGTGGPGGDRGDRVDPEGRAEGSGTTRSGDETRETSRREDEQEESGLTRVWRRVRN